MFHEHNLVNKLNTWPVPLFSWAHWWSNCSV